MTSIIRADVRGPQDVGLAQMTLELIDATLSRESRESRGRRPAMFSRRA